MQNNNILNIKNLSKLYGMEKNAAIRLKKSGMDKDEIFKKTGVTVAVWDVTMDVTKGEVFVIIGLSGSGKSTLVRCFNMLNKPTSGQILFDKDISRFNRKELANYRKNKISMVFQNFGLMSHRT